jgi:hypothetical protein
MRPTVFLAVVLILPNLGCHKSDTASDTYLPSSPATNAPSAGPPVASAPPAAPAPLEPPPGTAVETPQLKSGDVDQLTFELRKFVIANRRRPRDFQDFAASSGLQIPPPPAGKKYAINGSTMRVYLENE